MLSRRDPIAQSLQIRPRKHGTQRQAVYGCQRAQSTRAWPE
jgi:hypothetical protein